jgi:hypothetical protein
VTDLSTSPALALDPVARRTLPPYRYLWLALWWRKEASRGYPSAAASREYSQNQLRLFRDMLSHPAYYRLKPTRFTDWQWMENRT